MDVRFKNLEEMRARGWVELEPVAIKKKVVKAQVKKVTKPSRGPSQLKDLIAGDYYHSISLVYTPYIYIKEEGTD